MEFDNIKIRNDFKEYNDKDTKIDNSLIKMKDENNKFSIKIIKNALQSIGFEAVIGKAKYNEVLKRNNINTNSDLFRYTLNNKNEKITMFSSSKRIDEMVVVKNNLIYYFDVGEDKDINVYLIKGDYNGIIKKNDYDVSIELIDKDSIYLLTIKIDKDIDYIKDLISTIVIN